jgi:hypothetical protein
MSSYDPMSTANALEQRSGTRSRREPLELLTEQRLAPQRLLVQRRRMGRLAVQRDGEHHQHQQRGRGPAEA